MKRKNSISKFNMFLALALALATLVGTMAFFTDRVTGNADMTTMDKTGLDIVAEPDKTVDPDDIGGKDPNTYVDPDPGQDDDLTEWWAWMNTDAEVNFNPGDKMTLSYVLKNKGVLAVDVRETFVITTKTPLTATTEFQLFTAFTKDAAGANTGTTVVAGALPVTTSEVAGTTYYHYKYVVPAFTMSGSGTGAETIDGKPAELTKAYYMVFNKLSGNAFQGAKCTVDYIVEAKQHTDHANADDWQTATTTTLNLPTGGLNIPVVPKA